MAKDKEFSNSRREAIAGIVGIASFRFATFRIFSLVFRLEQ